MAITIPPELERRVLDRARASQRDPKAVLAELLEFALNAVPYRSDAEREEAFRRCLEAVGGTDDITDEDRAAVEAEWREVGLLPQLANDAQAR